MDYEKKYNDALNLAKSYYGNGCNEFLDTIFPELRESEDERVRQWLIDYFSSIGCKVWMHHDFTREQILEWLEKQKESLHIQESCKENANFFTDACKDVIVAIEKYLDWLTGYPDYAPKGKYSLRDMLHCLYVLEKQKEQKPKFYPGDVIKCTSTGSLWVRCKGRDNIRSDGHTACIGGGYELASEEEAVQFFQELNENGYQWDCIKGRPMKKEQKPVQSEEEKEYIRTLKSRIADFLRGKDKDEVDTTYYQRICDWLDGRHVEQKPAGWSEEDEKMRGTCIDLLEHFPRPCGEVIGPWKDCIAWLKSLRPQPRLSKEDFIKFGNLEYERGFKDGERSHWKPSEEQMNALRNAVNKLAKTDVADSVRLSIMYDNLKKLM